MLNARLRRGLAAVAVTAVGLLGLSVNASAAPDSDPSFEQPGDRFSLGILPDTQFHSRYATEETSNQYQRLYGSEPYETQTAWLADNAADYNIAGVLHLGDVVDQDWKPEQWQVASDAMAVLETGQLPYSVLAGNHDLSRGTDAYATAFPTSRAEQQAYADGTTTFVSATADAMNTAHLFVTPNGHEVLSIAISWFAASYEAEPYLDPATVAWAQSVIDAHPGVPTVLTSHQILNIAADGQTLIDTQAGDQLWNQMINGNDQIFLTYSGHHHGAQVRTKTNAAGNPVVQVLMDYQMAYMGGNGYLGLTEFDITNGKISQTSFSPWVLIKPAETLTIYDQALLDRPNESWTIDFDFASRFPELTPGESSPSATKALRDYIAANYTEPTPLPQTPATDADDYVQVEGTVAHWRMAGLGADGAVLPVGSTITDIAGTSTMTRGEGVGAWAPEQVTASTSHAPLSSDFGSVCFTDAGRNMGDDGATNTANFFATADGAPANAESFPNGFTLETFVKIDESYTIDNNRWMAWLSRDGMRQDVAGYVDGGDGEEPLMSWAFSNLNEVQFTFVDAKTPPVDDSAWSGEIVNYTEWMHIVAVNDPADNSVTMYVNGEPVLRNTVDQLGIATELLPWVLGAGSYAGVREGGFVGCIGETRLVDHPLTADQWLTHRASQDAPVPPITDPDDSDDVTNDDDADDMTDPTDGTDRPRPTQLPKTGSDGSGIAVGAIVLVGLAALAQRTLQRRDV